jgi:hypothetical protein
MQMNALDCIEMTIRPNISGIGAPIAGPGIVGTLGAGLK